MLELAKEMSKLKAFVHVSTAYSHCTRLDIDEKFYVSKDFDLKEVTRKLQFTSEKELIGKYPNTYNFTKAMTEQLIYEESGSLPIAIVRPSIVTCSLKEPIPGWVDSFNGITGSLFTQ